MKHFYSLSLAIIAMFSTQLLFAQSTTLAGNNMSLVASRVDFNNPGISLNQRTGFITESNPGELLKINEENDISAKEQHTNSDFRIFQVNSGNDFNASFIAPKSGKAVLQIKSISGQVIYKEEIEISKGNNSQLIKPAHLNSGMYLISIINEQVNYNGKLQKI